MKDTHTKRASILEKRLLLDRARKQLKKEFIGIDTVIDKIMDALSTWFCFPDMQERPVVVNLWGLTGVGKSALVKRLAKILEIENGYYHLNFSNRISGGRLRYSSMEGMMQDIHGGAKGAPVMMAFDEFQHVFGSSGESRDDLGLLWEMLDTGKFPVYEEDEDVLVVSNLTGFLKDMLSQGVMVSGGKLVFKKDYFNEKLRGHQGDNSSRRSLRRPSRESLSKFLLGEDDLDFKGMDCEKLRVYEDDLFRKNDLFVHKGFHKIIYEVGKGRFSGPSMVASWLRTLGGAETVKELERLSMYEYRAEEVDCSKAFIFVIGNLDDAYAMHDNLSLDMSADEFHEASLKITVPKIKQALISMRFRSEQVARLGNIHIIYPAFSEKSFRKIIQCELSKASERMQRTQGLRLQFDPSIEELVYKEGVYPTQGTRPLFSSLHQIVYTKFGEIVTECIVKELSPTNIRLQATNNSIRVKYMCDKRVLSTLSMPQELNLKNLRKSKKDDTQAIVAVHECGHAVLSSVLLKTVPEVIFSKTVGEEAAGFIYTKSKRDFICRKEITKRLAVFLGGYAAEEFVFGKENMTLGAKDDLRRTTFFITDILKSCGMGKGVPAHYNHAKDGDTNLKIYDKDDLLNEEAKVWIREALELAEKTLKEQRDLLLEMADYLSDHSFMDKKHVEKMLECYGHNLEIRALNGNGTEGFHRRHLKEQIVSIRAKEKNRSL